MTPLPRQIRAVLVLAVLAAGPLLAQTPDGVDILLGKARSLEARGRMDLAAQNWNQVLLVDPNRAEALAGLARQAKQSGDEAKTRGYLDRLRKINPRDPAIATVERMRVLTPQEVARLDEAGRLAGAKKPDEAMRIYREVFANEPPWGKWAEPFYATKALSTGGRPDAIAQLRALSSREPGNEVYRLWLARILSYDPKTRMEALRFLEAIHDSGTAEEARTIWRQALVWEKDNPAAQASLEAYVRRYPDGELQAAATRLKEHREHDVQEADKARGFQALRGKDTATAQQKFEEVLRRSPNDVNALAGLGFVRLDQKRFIEALALFDKARTRDPKRADIQDGYTTAQYWSAMERGAALQQRDADAALAAYQAALAIRPDDTDATLGIAQIMLSRKNLSEAGSRFELVLGRSPNNADATIGLGFVRLDEKKFGEAATLLERAHTMAPRRSDVDEGLRTAKFFGLMTQASAAIGNRPDAAMTGFEQALALDPSSTDALAGLAGAAERARNVKVAIDAYGRLAAAEPNDARGWLGLMRVQIAADDPGAALQTSRRVPATLQQHPDYLARLSLVLFATEQPSAGEKTLRRALDVSAGADTEDALAVRLQVAALLVKAGNIKLALSVYTQATDAHPTNVIGWQGLVGAYAETKDFTRILATVRAMPRGAYDAAAKNAGFLNAVAAANAAAGRCSEAEELLSRSLDLDKAAGRQSVNTRLQLADIWMREAQYDKAVVAYRDIVTVDERSGDGWRGYIVALHNQKDYRTVIAEARRMPAATRVQLEKETGFIALLANAQSKEGHSDLAVGLLNDARTRYRFERQPSPADLDLQLGWAMLASSNPAGVGDLVVQITARDDLTPTQRKGVDELWVTWTVARAESARKAGDGGTAIAILTNARRTMPKEPRISSALASVYLRQGDAERALDVYRSWGLTGADVGDYRAAAGAALETHDTMLADRWLQEALQQWPNDRELLHMTARRAIARGAYKEGQLLLEAALKAPVQPTRVPDRTANAGQIPLSVASSPACRQDGARVESGGPTIRLASFSRPPIVPSATVAMAQSSAAEAQQGRAVQDVQEGQRAKEIQDEIDSLKYRNTPFLSSAGVVTGRPGDRGLTRLVVEDAAMGASATSGDMFRFGFDIHAVSLFSGAPDGRSASRFGTAPPGAVFPEQKASGYAAEVQVSTTDLGLVLGTSPRGFLTDTWTGGLRLGQPDGLFKFIVVRERLRDSLLSYAGARDPGTGIVWGGVASNSATVQVSHNGASTGQYLSVGAGFLSGRNVADNWKEEGSGGAYWNVAAGEQGALTLGFNVAAMHYDRNLNFFSLGQGGYFSPQRFVQVSAPVTWLVKHDRVAYEIKASPGFQQFTEAAAPYYRTTLVQAPADPFAPLGYDARKQDGPSYNVALRVEYRVASHWHFGVFGVATNARDFDSRTVGVRLRFLTNRLPPNAELSVQSIPDWRGDQPFLH